MNNKYIYLVCDTRERFLHKLVDDTFTKNDLSHEISQINTGDYLICEKIGSETKILACIERKTLKDYAASFKDGRYRNTNKMLDLRDKTGCQLYYFVEGSVFLSPTYKIAGIPYRNIINSITNQMIRDNIHTVRTKDEQGTVDRLMDFVKAFGKIDICADHSIKTTVDSEPAKTDTPVSGGVDDITLVSGKIEKDDVMVVTEMWAKLPGISIATARNIVDVYSFANICTTPKVDLTVLKTPGGRALMKKGITSINSLIAGCSKMNAKIISGIPGISLVVSKQIAQLYNLSQLIDLTSTSFKLADFKVQQKNRQVRLGDAKAERTLKFLNYSISAAAEGTSVTAT